MIVPHATFYRNRKRDEVLEDNSDLTKATLPGQAANNKRKTMKQNPSQSHWARSCLHLAAAPRAGRWPWRLAGVRRESELANNQTQPTLKPIIGFLLLSLSNWFPVFGFTNLGSGVLQTDGTATDTQAAIIAAPAGSTVRIPAGTFAWTSGISNSGKGIKLEGAGGGSLQGHSTSPVTIGTGAKTFATQSGLGFIAGQTVRAYFTADGRNNYMEGTVTSYAGTSLTIYAATAVGSGTRPVWALGIVQATTITHNAGATVIVQLTESVTQSVELSGLRFIEGSARDGLHVRIDGVVGGKPVLIHDCWFSTAGPMLRSIQTSVNRGIIYRCSFDSGFYSGNGNGIGNDDQAIGFKNDQNTSAWTETSKMGMDDVDGLGNFYVEDCYFAGIYLQTMDFDGNARAAVRYCTFNNSAMSSHGADTGPVGARHYQIYNNNFVFNDSGTLTYPLEYVFFIRGGTGVIADNVLSDMQSTQWGTKPAIKMTVMNLRRNAGPNPCWNGGYPAPRQVGMGRVSGSGGNDSITYAGDSEPLYIWNNLGNPSVVTSDFGGSECTSSASSSSYIQAGRDYFNNGTAKPGFVKYTYPHPLRGGGQALGAPVITGSPQSLMCVLGQSASFSVSASGAAPLFYQWQRGIEQHRWCDRDDLYHLDSGNGRRGRLSLCC
jgi:hypothetical protein